MYIPVHIYILQKHLFVFSAKVRIIYVYINNIFTVNSIEEKVSGLRAIVTTSAINRYVTLFLRICTDDSWQSVLTIVDFYGDNSDDFASMAGPGHWNDPDMVET